MLRIRMRALLAAVSSASLVLMSLAPVSLMAGQPFLQDAPAGLAGILGVSEPEAAHTFVRTYDSDPRYTYSEPRSGSAWKWVLPLLVLGLLGYFAFRRPPTRPTVVTVSIPRAEIQGLLPPALGPSVSRTLRKDRKSVV